MESITSRDIALQIVSDIRALPVRNTPSMRRVRRNYSKFFVQSDPDFVIRVARELLGYDGYRWVAYELIRYHPGSFARISEAEIEELGQGMDSWWTVDSFARTLAGPAWLRGQIDAEVIHRWARSDDLWWRRAALVSTVALNLRSKGGFGDTERTLAVCRILVDDHEDMVVKALSWALRELVVHDPRAIRAFLDQYCEQLHPRVRREVTNKLETGLKNP